MVALGANGETAAGTEPDDACGVRLEFCAKAPEESAIAVAAANKESTGVRFIKNSSIRLGICHSQNTTKSGAMGAENSVQAMQL